MCTFASQKGHCAIALTDHGPSLCDSPHLWHFQALSKLPRRICGVYVLRGAEANILSENGEIDLPEKTLKRLDYVIASFHDECFRPANYGVHTKAVENILKNPFINTLGHMGNPKYMFDYEYIISQCNQYGKIIELNAHSSKVRLGSFENCLEIARLCSKHQVPVVLTSDAHSCFDVGEVEDAIEVAKRSGIDKDLILNTDAIRLYQYFMEKKGLNIFSDQ